MTRITRREWMGAAAGAIGSAATAAQARQAPVGVQLYTVREPLRTEPEGTLRAIAEIGYRAVEGGRAELLRFGPWLKQYGLAAPSCMIETALVTGNWDAWSKGSPGLKPVEWDQALESIAAIGARFAVVPYLLPGAERGAGDYFRQFSDRMNAAGEKCRKAGVTLCYHNHAFEFGGQPGERPIDIMLARFDRELAAFELDVFWVSVAGVDPVEFLQAIAGRVPLVHLKDKAAGTPVQYTEAVKPQSFAEVGSGTLDFPAILKAAGAAGVQHHFVEQDQTPGDPVDSLRKSYSHLKTLGAL